MSVLPRRIFDVRRGANSTLQDVNYRKRVLSRTCLAIPSRNSSRDWLEGRSMPVLAVTRFASFERGGVPVSELQRVSSLQVSFNQDKFLGRNLGETCGSAKVFSVAEDHAGRISSARLSCTTMLPARRSPRRWFLRLTIMQTIPVMYIPGSQSTARNRLRPIASNALIARPESLITRIPAVRFPGVCPFQMISKKCEISPVNTKQEKD